MNAYLEAPKKGLATMINNKSILEWSKILLNLSKKGLQKRNIKNKSGKDESIFLKNIENTLLNKKTKAEKIIEDFNDKNILANNKTKAEQTIEKFQDNNNLNFLYEKT